MGLAFIRSLHGFFIMAACVFAPCCATGLPVHKLSLVGSQQSLYVHKSLLNAYAGYRSKLAVVNSFVNPLFKPIGPIEWDLFNTGQPIYVDHFEKTEPELPSFIADERLPTNDTITSYPALEPLPVYTYHVAVIYNLNSVDSGLESNPSTIVVTLAKLIALFNGLIPTWADFGFTTLPANFETTRVAIVGIKGRHRVSEILNQFLYDADPKWYPQSGAGSAADETAIFDYTAVTTSASPPDYVWVDTQDAVIGMVMNTKGAIGCVSWVNYKASGVKAGVFQILGVAPGVETLKTVISPEVDYMKNSELITKLKSIETAYPLVGFSYIIIPNSPKPKYGCDTAVELLRYYRWLMRNEKAKARLVKDFGVVTLPDATYDKLITYLSFKLKCSDSGKENLPVWDLMLDTMAKEIPPNVAMMFVLYFLVPVLSLAVAWFAGGYFVYKAIHIYKVKKGRYQIRSKNIVFIATSRERYKEMLKMRPYLDNHDSKGAFTTGEYGFCVVLLRPIYLPFNAATAEVKKELINMQDWKTHNNLAKFLGVTEIRQDRYIVSELSLLGDLRTLLSTKSVKLTCPISYFMARGVVNGVEYLHSQDIVHGNLRTTSIYVESDWTVKISDWEYVHLYRMQGIYLSKELVFKSMFKAPKDVQNVYFTPLLWVAPEVLKATLDGKGLLPTKASDIYSFAIVFYEIITRNMPYKFNSDAGDSPLSLLMRILHRRKPLCPLDLEATEAQSEIPESMQIMMKSCWSADPKLRLKTDEIALIFRAVQAETKRMADLTIVHTDYLIDKQKSEIKSYNSDLKQRVLDLRKASEDFLTPMVYEKIRAKINVEPTYTERAYILHLTMVDYDDLLEETHGESAIALIERFQVLVSQFIIGLHDPNIFRLHTAGDDCTVIGAVPAGGIEYADKMAVLALDLLTITWKAVMLDIDTDHIKIRLGIHCGPVISGLHGTDHTEFTVIGETRDIAEDMERLSGTYRVLISHEFAEDLNHFEGYSYINNTDRERAHEKVRMYWLLGRENYSEQGAINEIYAEYGSITDGRVPERFKEKKLQPAVEFRSVPTERAQSRRASLASHKAIKEEGRERAAILERRNSATPDQGRHRSSVAEVLEVLPEQLTRTGIEKDATYDVIHLDNNQELVVVDFTNEEQHERSPSTNLLHVEISAESIASTVTVPKPQGSFLPPQDRTQLNVPGRDILRYVKDDSMSLSLSVSSAMFPSKSNVFISAPPQPYLKVNPAIIPARSKLEVIGAASVVVSDPDLNTSNINVSGEVPDTVVKNMDLAAIQRTDKNQLIPNESSVSSPLSHPSITIIVPTSAKEAVVQPLQPAPVEKTDTGLKDLLPRPDVLPDSPPILSGLNIHVAKLAATEVTREAKTVDVNRETPPTSVNITAKKFEGTAPTQSSKPNLQRQEPDKPDVTLISVEVKPESNQSQAIPVKQRIAEMNALQNISQNNETNKLPLALKIVGANGSPVVTQTIIPPIQTSSLDTKSKVTPDQNMTKEQTPSTLNIKMQVKNMNEVPSEKNSPALPVTAAHVHLQSGISTPLPPTFVLKDSVVIVSGEATITSLTKPMTNIVPQEIPTAIDEQQHSFLRLRRRQKRKRHRPSIHTHAGTDPHETNYESDLGQTVEDEAERDSPDTAESKVF